MSPGIWVLAEANWSKNNFTWSALSEKTISAYEQILAGKYENEHGIQ